MNEVTVIVPEEVSGEVNRMTLWARSLVIASQEDRNKAMDAVCHLSRYEIKDVPVENIIKAAELLGRTVNMISVDDIEVM